MLVLSSLCDPWIEYLHLSFEIQVRNCPARWKTKYLLRLKYCLSVAKCRGSKVVGRGRGSWVWVNVVGKTSIENHDKVIEKKLIEKSCKISMKRKSPTP